MKVVITGKIDMVNLRFATAYRLFTHVPCIRFFFFFIIRDFDLVFIASACLSYMGYIHNSFSCYFFFFLNRYFFLCKFNGYLDHLHICPITLALTLTDSNSWYMTIIKLSINIEESWLEFQLKHADIRIKILNIIQTILETTEHVCKTQLSCMIQNVWSTVNWTYPEKYSFELHVLPIWVDPRLNGVRRKVQ